MWGVSDWRPEPRGPRRVAARPVVVLPVGVLRAAVLRAAVLSLALPPQAPIGLQTRKSRRSSCRSGHSDADGAIFDFDCSLGGLQSETKVLEGSDGTTLHEFIFAPGESG